MPLDERAHWVLSWAFHRQNACIFELSDLPSQAAREADPLPLGYTFRLAEPQDMPGCAAMAGADVEQYVHRGFQGEQCYLVEADGQPVNLSWLHFGSCYVRGLGLLIRAEPTTCYLYNVYTDPSQRGKGLYKSTQRMLIQLLAARGVTRITQVVEAQNRIPQVTLPQFGYRHAWNVSHLNVCGVKLSRICDTEGGNAGWQVHWRTPSLVHLI